MSHIGCSSHVKYQDANCFSFSQATHWPSPSSWLVPIQNSQVDGTVISAIFSSSSCFIFCSWLFPPLPSFFTDGWQVSSFFFRICLCVCTFYPPLLQNSLCLPFFFAFAPPPPLCSFFNLLSFCSLFLSLSFTFFLNFAVSFPQFLLPLQIHPVQCT